MAKEPGEVAFYAAGWVTPWDHLDDQTRAQWSAIEAAIRASALEEAAKVADSEPELPGVPSAEHIALMRDNPIESARAAVRATKASIAAAIRSLIPSHDGGEHG